MPHVLLMAAEELRDPMAFRVLVESCDRYDVTHTLYSSNSVRDVSTGRLRSTSTSHQPKCTASM